MEIWATCTIGREIIVLLNSSTAFFGGSYMQLSKALGTGKPLADTAPKR
jgi:hypothetical protein